MSTDILVLLLGIISFLRRYIRVEKQIGTIRAGYRYAVTAITTALVFTVISFLLYQFQIATIVYLGIWPIVMSEIVIDCYSNPNT